MLVSFPIFCGSADIPRPTIRRRGSQSHRAHQLGSDRKSCCPSSKPGPACCAPGAGWFINRTTCSTSRQSAAAAEAGLVSGCRRVQPMHDNDLASCSGQVTIVLSDDRFNDRPPMLGAILTASYSYYRLSFRSARPRRHVATMAVGERRSAAGDLADRGGNRTCCRALNPSSRPTWYESAQAAGVVTSCRHRALSPENSTGIDLHGDLEE